MKILLLGLLLISTTLLASPYPVITSVRVEKNLDDTWYYFTQKVMEIGSTGNVILPAAPVGIGMRVGLGIKNDIQGPRGETVVSYVSSLAFADGIKTVSELAMEVYNKDGKNMTTLHLKDPYQSQECLGYIAAYPSIYGPYGDWATSIRPGGCMIAPPAQDWCKITTPEIVLDHGQITLKEAEGNIASTTLGLQCTTDMAVTFNLVTQDKYVYLDEGKSEITVNNEPLNTKIDLKSGDSQLPINDLLTGITKEGFHTGSSVLVMMPY